MNGRYQLLLMKFVCFSSKPSIYCFVQNQRLWSEFAGDNPIVPSHFDINLEVRTLFGKSIYHVTTANSALVNDAKSSCPPKIQLSIWIFPLPIALTTTNDRLSHFAAT